MHLEEFYKQYYCRCYALLQLGYVPTIGCLHTENGYFKLPPPVQSGRAVLVDPMLFFLDKKPDLYPLFINNPYLQICDYYGLSTDDMIDFYKALRGECTSAWLRGGIIPSDDLTTYFGYMIYGIIDMYKLNARGSAYTQWHAKLRRQFPHFFEKIQQIDSSLQKFFTINNPGLIGRVV